MSAGLRIAVNISARQIQQSEFVSEVLGILEATGADPWFLELELTESHLVRNVQDSIGKMSALDDFGTGYSSLSYLKLLPLDQVKIDRSFVRTIITLAQTLGLEVIAEGVETAEQRDFLAEAGCRAFQGFLFSQALEPREIGEYLRARAPRKS